MKVLKFGGTSVANAENIQKVINIIKRGNQPQIVVVSALSGVTDLLIKAGTLAEKSDETFRDVLQQLEKKHLDTVRMLLPVTHQSSCLSAVKQQFNELEETCNSIFYLRELSLRTRDRVIALGELLSSKIVSAHLQSINVDHEWIDSRKVIKTNSNFGFAAVNFSVTNDLISYTLASSHKKLFIVPGFIASDEHGNTTTLGRGGSDYTAAIFAAAVNATSLEIWTDVAGMMTADPRWVPNAKTIERISYQEAM
jgi:bifunctional aspartokinase / homoserine dehydrogenase 1